MKKYMFFSFILVLFALALHSEEFFGQNKIQYRRFDWKILETDHFLIYYYNGMDSLSLIAANIVEQTYDSFSVYFNIKPNKKIPIILYRSHSHFEQTNVSPEIIEEWVGGFTEIMKDRMVIPFTGDYEEFRHVLMHELVHAFQFFLLYKGGMSDIVDQYMYTIPLWYIEGMAEYFSLGMDAECDMFLYDAFVNDTFPSFEYLDYSGYGVYKYGQGILFYIGKTYGKQAVTRVLSYTRRYKSFEEGIKKSLGIDINRLEKDFHRYLVKRYSKVASLYNLQPSYGWSLKLRHKEKYSFAEGVSISPDGNYIVYLTNSSGYIDLYLTSLYPEDKPKRLISFGKTGVFESMHYTRPSFRWDNASHKIVFSAKKNGKDIVYIYDVFKRKILKTLNFNKDAIYYVSFGKDTTEMYFSGVYKGYTDLYYYDIKTGREFRLTNDMYSDWAPTLVKDNLYFISDRPDRGKTYVAGDYAIFKYVSQDSFIRVSPRMMAMENLSYFNGNFYVSGIVNGEYAIFRIDTTGNMERISDVYSSVKSPSISSSGRMVYLIYRNREWDIWVTENVNTLSAYNLSNSSKIDRISLISPKLFSGNYAIKKREIKFGIDWIGGMFLYNSLMGPMGYLVGFISDDLGDHRIAFALAGQDEWNYDLEGAYWYLPMRLDIGIYGIYAKYTSYVGSDSYYDYYYSLSYGGVGLQLSYPFDRFNRIDIYGDFSVLSSQYMAYDVYMGDMYYSVPLKDEMISSYIEYVHDNAIWGYYSPISGSLMRLGVYTVLVNTNSFFTDIKSTIPYYRYIKWDWRNYWRITQRSVFALRVLSMDNILDTLSYSFTDEYIRMPLLYTDDGLYFAGGITGGTYYYLVGSHIRALQSEYRFPLIDEIRLSCGASLGTIRGSLFIDVLDASSDYWPLFSMSYDMSLIHTLIEYGAGLRIFTLGTVVKLDFIWGTNIKYNGFMGVGLSIGPEF